MQKSQAGPSCLVVIWQSECRSLVSGMEGTTAILADRHSALAKRIGKVQVLRGLRLLALSLCSGFVCIFGVFWTPRYFRSTTVIGDSPGRSGGSHSAFPFEKISSGPGLNVMVGKEQRVVGPGPFPSPTCISRIHCSSDSSLLLVR